VKENGFVSVFKGKAIVGGVLTEYVIVVEFSATETKINITPIRFLGWGFFSSLEYGC
jgi:hypothetical protein